jgi:acetyl esterase/lipase
LNQVTHEHSRARRQRLAAVVLAVVSARALWALSGAAVAAEPQVVILWPRGAPGSEGKTGAEAVRISDQGEHVVSNVHAPSLSVFLPARNNKATAAGVIVIPGGGHTELWMDHEGYNVAAFLTAHGVAAFVLKYRLARAKHSTYTVEGSALADVQRAIRLVRDRSSEWHVDPGHVGVMGFSAGGELAALAATRSDGGEPSAADPIDRRSSRPAFQALFYPTIPEGMKLSTETPPAFLLAGSDDRPGISQGIATLYLALRKAGAPAELHIYDGVGHGFGLRSGNAGPVAEWPKVFVEWLNERGFK